MFLACSCEDNALVKYSLALPQYPLLSVHLSSTQLCPSKDMVKLPTHTEHPHMVFKNARDAYSALPEHLSKLVCLSQGSRVNSSREVE